MIIANPLYDVTFKRIIENDRSAKFLIGTILDCEVISLTPNIQERTYEKSETREIALFRMDFSATIKTKEEGEKKVLIELQKALHAGDIKRFRGYLGSEYINSTLPLITIYILGFDLSIDAPAIVANPECWNLLTKQKIDTKDHFIQHLTHKAYFIQTLKIKPSYNTRLEKLLSVFEQANFIGHSQITKAYTMSDIEPELNEIVKMLQYMAADDDLKNELNYEEYYHQEMENMFGNSNREIIEKSNIIKDNIKKLAEKDKRLAEKDKKLAEKEKNLKDIVINLKLAGMPNDKIAEITGLNIKEINKIT